VLVAEVDVVDAEPPERVVDRLPDILLTSAHPEPAAVLPAHVAELGRELHLVAPPGDRPPDELLVDERPVHVSGVQEGHAEVERPADGLGGPGVVVPAVELAHAHAAQAQGRHGQAAVGGAEDAGVDGGR